jgi:flagellar basal-body rod modification protein FlgD
MEGTEFTAQLAQFSSLEQLRNIGDGIGRLEESQAALHRTEALAYLGKEAAVADERLTVAGGQADPVRFSLSEDAAVAVVSVADGAGNPVRIFDRSALVAGEHQIEWNGCDARGNPLADGTYRVEVSAFDGSNRPVAAQPFAVERITGLSVEEAATTLLIGERRIGVDQIIEVTEP